MSLGHNASILLEEVNFPLIEIIPPAPYSFKMDNINVVPSDKNDLVEMLKMLLGGGSSPRDLLSDNVHVLPVPPNFGQSFNCDAQIRQIKDQADSFIDLGLFKIIYSSKRSATEEVIQKIFNIKSRDSNPLHSLPTQLSFLLASFGDYERITYGHCHIDNPSIEDSKITTCTPEFHKFFNILQSEKKNLLFVKSLKENKKSNLLMRRLCV